ncbi:MAG: malate dehydrogenase [Thermoplasmata archaeon]
MIDSGKHVAVVGTGRVGRATLLLLAHERWIDRLTLVDTKPELAGSIAEEVRHSLGSTENDIDVVSYDEDDSVEGADIVLITAGAPRTKDMKDRTDLTEANARIIKDIAEAVGPTNPDAYYVVVTNPVDAMATLFKKLSNADWVISTGTNLESLRFRAELSKRLDVPITSIKGFVGGEHGKDAVFLWSTVEIHGMPLERYLRETNGSLDIEQIQEHVKEISRQIIKTSGGTRMGPAVSFRDILRSIALNENKILPVAAPYQGLNIKEEVMVSTPRVVGKMIGDAISLPDKEMVQIENAAEKIHEVYVESFEGLTNLPR